MKLYSRQMEREDTIKSQKDRQFEPHTKRLVPFFYSLAVADKTTAFRGSSGVLVQVHYYNATAESQLFTDSVPYV